MDERPMNRGELEAAIAEIDRLLHKSLDEDERRHFEHRRERLLHALSTADG